MGGSTSILTRVNCGYHTPEAYKSSEGGCVFVGSSPGLRVLNLSDTVMNRLWFSREKKGRYFTLINRSFDIEVKTICRRTCFSGSQKQNVAGLTRFCVVYMEGHEAWQ